MNLELSAKIVREAFENWQTPCFYIQFGTGFDVDLLFDEQPQVLEFKNLPDMPDYHNPDFEQPVLLYGSCEGVSVLVARGHRHLYEGLGVNPCILPVCTAWKLGIRRHIYIESSLGLRTDWKPGTWTLLTDFINNHPFSPLDGLHHLLEYPFPDMTDALSQYQNSEFVNEFAKVGIDPHLGVFLSRPGSQFCTVAEAAAARQSGADIVGHDLVMEIIMAHSLGCKVSAFALLAAPAPQANSRPLKRQAILDNCKFCTTDFMRGFRPALREISKATWDFPTVPLLPSSEAEDILYNNFKRPTGHRIKYKLLRPFHEDDGSK